MKMYECVEVKYHKDVGKTIEEWQRDGSGYTGIRRLVAIS